MSFIISFGKYGGFYYQGSSASQRLCLGWMALTYFNRDIDEIFIDLMGLDLPPQEQQ